MIAIKNARIISVTSPEISQGTLITNGKTIGVIGKTTEVKIPQRARVIDANGAILLPGFIDSHCHLGMDEIGESGSQSNENSSPFTPCVNAKDSITPDEEFFYRAIQRGGITAALVSPGSANVFGGISVAIKVKPTVDIEEILLKDPCHLKMALGENPARVYGSRGLTPASKMGVCEFARRKFEEAQIYLQKKEKYMKDSSKDPLDFAFDRDLDVLCKVLKRELSVEIHAHNYEDMMFAIRLQKEFQIRMHIVHGTEAFKMIPNLQKANMAVTFSPQLSVARKSENRYKNLHSCEMMAKAGLLYAISTDHPVYPMDLLPLDAALSMKEGLSLDQALQAITINAARIMGVENRVGSLESGKDADFVLWSEHPLLYTQAKVKMVFIDGEMVYDGNPSPRQMESLIRTYRSAGESS